MRDKETTKLKKLSNKKTEYIYEYDASQLECFDNQHPGNDYFVDIDCPEFTCLCPITGQPDFGHLRITYIPDKKIVESKSLKLYLFSFRSHGDFHEDVVNVVMKDLIALLDPKYIEVQGLFNPRGGISLRPFCNYGRAETKWEEMAWKRLLDYTPAPARV